MNRAMVGGGVRAFIVLSFIVFSCTLGKAEESVDSVNICSSNLPYRWNGIAYFYAGTFTTHLVSSVGLDSVAKLVLSVTKPVNPCVKIIADSQTVCRGATVNILATNNLSVRVHYTLLTPYYTLNMGDGTDSIFKYTPKNGDSVSVRMDLSDTIGCFVNQPVYSNTLLFKVKDSVVPKVVLTSSSEVADGSPVKFNALVTDGGDKPVCTFRINQAVVQFGFETSYTMALPSCGDSICCCIHTAMGCFVNDSAKSNVVVLKPKNAFALYPNPASGYVTIDCPQNKRIGELYLTSASGKVLLCRKLATSHTCIDLYGIVSGVYMATLASNEGRLIQKLVVR